MLKIHSRLEPCAMVLKSIWSSPLMSCRATVFLNDLGQSIGHQRSSSLPDQQWPRFNLDLEIQALPENPINQLFSNSSFETFIHLPTAPTLNTIPISRNHPRRPPHPRTALRRFRPRPAASVPLLLHAALLRQHTQCLLYAPPRLCPRGPEMLPVERNARRLC
jgi:hypothetical protein